MALPPDPRKHKKPASKSVEKPEPDHIANASKMVAGADHLADPGKVIEDRRGSKPGEFGQPPHIATDENRRLVKALAAYGNRQDDIATILDISHDTLTRHYGRELKTGALEANAKVAEKMYKKAIDGDNSCMQYWLSRRAGWKETTTHEHTGAGGGPIETRQLPATDEWLKQFAGAGSKTPPAEPRKD